MALLSFEEYVSKGFVKKRRKNRRLARSLLTSASDRMNFAKSILKDKPRYALELAYEAVIELVDALLALEGFKSWSHEASIAFLRKIGFKEFEVRRIDLSRRKRHSSKYYGVSFQFEESKSEVEFLEKIFTRIQSEIKKRLK